MTLIDQKPRNSGIAAEMNLQAVYAQFKSAVEERFSAVQAERIIHAADLSMEVASLYKVRYDGRRRAFHPLEVAYDLMVELEVTDHELVIAALLHDVVEDQPEQIVGLTQLPEKERLRYRDQALQVIEGHYGERVRRIVDILTNPPFEEMAAAMVSSGDDRSLVEIENELYDRHFREIAEKDKDAFLVKFADFTRNALSIAKVPEGALKEHLRRRYFAPMCFLIEYLQQLDNPEYPLVRKRDVLLAHILDVYRYEYQSLEELAMPCRE